MPTMRAPANRCRIARSAGVAITTSPTQFGRKMAMFMAWTFNRDLLRRPHLLEQPARRITVMQRRQMDAAAVRFDKLRADDLISAVVGALDQHVRSNRANELERRRLVKRRYEIDGLHAGEHGCPRCQRLERPALAL